MQKHVHEPISKFSSVKAQYLCAELAPAVLEVYQPCQYFDSITKLLATARVASRNRAGSEDSTLTIFAYLFPVPVLLFHP